MNEYLNRFLRWSIVGVLASTIVACVPAEQEDDLPADDGWSCDTPRDGWERCDGDSVVWCHAVVHGNYSGGHFHEGANCAQDGLECIELTDSLAACADASRPCDAGFAQCDGRQALNCVDGKTTTMRCSLSETCQVGPEGARCQPTKQD